MGIFRFKHFEVRNEASAMKVNTDGVLLGAAVHIPASAGNILDIGTGTGTIALMLAQRTTQHPLIASDNRASEGIHGSRCGLPDISGRAQILGIDIDPEAAGEAEANFRASAWSDRLTAECISLAGLETAIRDAGKSSREIQPEATRKLSASMAGTAGLYYPQTTFDLIVSNPPYYDASLINPDSRKATARHADVIGNIGGDHEQKDGHADIGISLSYREILDFSSRHLSHDGKVALILPSEQEAGLLRYGRMHGLHLRNILRIKTVGSKLVRRIIAEFGRMRTTTEEASLTIMENGHYTEEYLTMMKDFYLFA